MTTSEINDDIIYSEGEAKIVDSGYVVGYNHEQSMRFVGVSDDCGYEHPAGIRLYKTAEEADEVAAALQCDTRVFWMQLIEGERGNIIVGDEW